MLRFAMATADELCGLVAGGVSVSVHVEIKHTIVKLNTAPMKKNQGDTAWQASKVSPSNSEHLTLEQFSAISAV